MTGRIVQWTLLVCGLAFLSLLSISNVSAVSTYSTFDSGRNGYLAMYNVLSDEGIPMERAQRPLGLEIGNADVWLITSTALDNFNAQYDGNELKNLRAFVKRGGLVVLFTAKNAKDRKIAEHQLGFTPRYFNVGDFTNGALDKQPARLLDVYAVLAGRGAVLVDERIHGYDANRSLWSALPQPVHLAAWLVVIAVLVALVGANVRVAPPIRRDPPADRDSSTYILSMASLLRRARAPHRKGTT